MALKYIKTVGLQQADYIGNSNEIIQEAIDQVASNGGGIVRLLEGTYTCHDSIHLKSGVFLEGCGSKTILWKPPSVSSRTQRILGYGHYEVVVEEPEKFHVGQGVYVRNELRKGFLDTVAKIHSIHDNVLGLTRMLNCDIKNGTATSIYPVINGCDIKNSGVQSLVIDGNKEENEYLQGCRGGGIFLFQAHEIKINDVVVKNYNGDGISFQQCIDTVITNCQCIDNRGFGLHPGSGSVGAIIRKNQISGNKKDGIYYCLRVSFSICEDNWIENNGRHGISIGHKDEDLLIQRNQVLSNSGNGIHYRETEQSGYRTLIQNNQIKDNSKLDGGGEIYIGSRVQDVTIYQNGDLNTEKAIMAKDPSFLEGISFQKPAENAYKHEYSKEHLRHLFGYALSES